MAVRSAGASGRRGGVLKNDLNALRLSGCGTQHPHRALGGTCVLLAAAPTTLPCFRHWRRSSSLLRIISGKNIFNFGFQESLRTFLKPFFTGGSWERTLSVIAARCQLPRRGSFFAAAGRFLIAPETLDRANGVRPLRHRCAMPHSPFCRCATSSPGAGEVFPQRERQEHCRKLPH